MLIYTHLSITYIICDKIKFDARLIGLHMSIGFSKTLDGLMARRISVEAPIWRAIVASYVYSLYICDAIVKSVFPFAFRDPRRLSRGAAAAVGYREGKSSSGRHSADCILV